jgi:hypothetical protein
MSMRRYWKLTAAVVAALTLTVVAAGYLWLTNLATPMPEAEAALISDERVSVDSEPWLTFTPSAASASGLIFYPGARVPPEAYAPPMRAIAEAGYTSIVPSMPLGLAVLSPDAADGIIEAHPEIEHWVIAGHSLGGAMAAQYAAGHEAIDGLALWAAYPPDGTDLSGAGIAVGSVHATADGLVTSEEIEDSRTRLPPDAVFTEIDGGVHAGFGWYGEQEGDGTATISRDEQQAQAVEATLDLLDAVGAR